MPLRYLPAAMAFLLAATSAPAVSLTIFSDIEDNQVSENGVGGPWYGNKTLRAGDSGVDTSVIYLFALPELALGESIISASFSVGLLEMSDDQQVPNFNLDLYGLGYRSDNELLDTDFYEGLFDEDLDAVGLQEAFITPGSQIGSAAVTDATGSANLTSFLNGLYLDGAVAGDYAVLRLNNDVTNAGNYYYYTVAAGNHDNAAMRATVTTVPEPSTTAALIGAGAFGLVLMRRRFRR